MKNKKVNIVGFECIYENKEYIFPRAKLNKKYCTPICFKRNGQRYFNIYDWFRDIYEDAYTKRNKVRNKFEKYISTFVIRISEKHKNHVFTNGIHEIYDKTKLYHDNYISIKNKKINKISKKGYLVNIFSIKINQYNIFEIKNLYKYQIIEKFIIITKATQQYEFKLCCDNRYRFIESECFYEKHNYYSGIYCTKCEKISGIEVKCHKYFYKSCKCYICKTIGRCSDTRDPIASIYGKLIGCIKCQNKCFHDMKQNGPIPKISIKRKLIKKFNTMKNNPFFIFFDNKLNQNNVNLTNFHRLYILNKLFCDNTQLESNYIKNLTTEERNKRILCNVWRINRQYENINTNLKNMITMMNTKISNKKYKNRYLINIYINDPEYIQHIISNSYDFRIKNNFDIHCYSCRYHKNKCKKHEPSCEIYKKTKPGTKTRISKIFRYFLELPLYPCDKYKCKNIALYGTLGGFPHKCKNHKKTKHILAIQTKCIGLDGICPYDSKRGKIEYDNYCVHCFSHLFPNDKRVTNMRFLSKEIKVINHICLKHSGTWYHNKPIYINFENGCCPTKRRIDLRQMIGNTMLCIEIDEDQHKSYCEYDDFVRYNEFVCDLTSKFIFIRFNPDKYKSKKIIRDPSLKYRLQQLDKEIYLQIKRINDNKNEDLLEIIYMFYDK
jgi:hypothetical protein